ncbi:MAG: hypothetical protein ACREA0_00445 [bacterium]
MIFRSINVPVQLIPGVHALVQAVVEEGESVEDAAALLHRIGVLLRYRVPHATSRISTKLISLAALVPLTRLVKNLASENELRVLFILADAGVALEFETGAQVAVRYPDT